MVIGTSAKALLKGIDTWKKETMMKRVKKILFFLLIARFLNKDFHFLDDILKTCFRFFIEFQDAERQRQESESKPSGE